MRESTEVHRFSLHIPLDLWEPLQRLAKKNHRSITSQINVLINAEIMRSGIEFEEKANEPTEPN